MRAGKRRVVRKRPVATRTSPSRETSADLADERADKYQKASGTGAVKRKWLLGTDCIQATVAATGGAAGDGLIPDAFAMVVDQKDQLVPIR